MKEKKKRGRLIPLAVIFIFAGALMFGIMKIVTNPKQYQTKSILAKELELTDKQESAMLDIFARCGIGEITSASKFQGGEGHISYHLGDEETDAYKGADYAIVVWVDDESKAIESIYFHDQDIYVNGVVLGQVTDYYVNSQERENYRISSQLAVNQLLNYPDTAKYPSQSGWRFGIEEGIVIVQSSVTAKNAFDMENTNDFQVKFTNGTITSLILDGIEHIK